MTEVAMDDIASTLAERYATALYALADERKILDRTIEEMDALGRLIAESAPMRRLLAVHMIPLDQVKAALESVLSGQGFGDLVRRFVAVAADNRRLADLAELVSGFGAYAASRRGIVLVEVISAHPLADSQRGLLTARLAEAGYGRVTLRERVDPGLLGGLVVKIGSNLYDTSLKSRLQRLRYAMKGAN